MAILALSLDRHDMQQRLEDLVVAYDKNGFPVTALDLGKIFLEFYTREVIF